MAKRIPNETPLSIKTKTISLEQTAADLAGISADCRRAFAERCGIKYASTNFKIDYLSRTSVLPAQNALFGQPVTNLLLYDSTQDNVSEAKKQFDQILLDMKVSTQAVDISKSSTLLPDFSNYKTVVVLVPDLDVLGQDLITLMNWAQQGGSILFAMTPSKPPILT